MEHKNDILYTCDNNYLDIMLASIISLLKISKLDNIRLHIITDNFNKNDYNKVYQILSIYPNVELYFYNLDEYDINKYNIPKWCGCRIANSRLFFQDILGKNIDSIDNLLYIDCDTIIVSDLRDIIKFSDETICACKDRTHNKYCLELNLDKYFNSGIIYFNVKKWIKEDCQKLIKEYLKDNKVNYNFPDQDILNLVFKDKIKMLPLNYNVNPDVFIYKDLFGNIYFNKKMRTINYDEANDARLNPKILHSYALANIKPWSNNKVNPFNEIFTEYIKLVNENFQLEELKYIKKIMSVNPTIFYAYLFIRPYISTELKNNGMKLLKKMTHN